MRTRGLIGYIMTDPQITGPSDSYALFVRHDGAIRMVHSEGVAYEVTDEKPWTWTDYAEVPSYAPADLLALTATAEKVDLADWVRTFGSRLEVNFHLIERWMLQNAGATK